MRFPAIAAALLLVSANGPRAAAQSDPGTLKIALSAGLTLGRAVVCGASKDRVAAVMVAQAALVEHLSGGDAKTMSLRDEMIASGASHQRSVGAEGCSDVLAAFGTMEAAFRSRGLMN